MASMERSSVMGQLRCPRDGTVMERVTLGTMSVDRCDICRGMWLDLGELQKLVARPTAAATLDPPMTLASTREMNKSMLVGAMVCPRDGETLRERADAKQEHVRVDECPSCKGVFLDAGELRDLSEHTIGEKLKRFFSLK
jgi:Zn-finger nucleic acid-binding protein